MTLNKNNVKIIGPILIILTLIFSKCTGQIPGSFRFLQQDQTFSSAQSVNTKIDLLWVVDNSSSMDVHQQKLRNGFHNFTTKYLLPTWDIQVAVITTDTYLANPAYSGYLSKQILGSVGYTSSYLSSLSWLSSYRNPVWDSTLVDDSTGTFDFGLTYGDLNPLWGPDYALLKPGIHDGPITALCSEVLPYFLKGVTQCNIRDNYAIYSGSANCVNPNVGSGQSSLSQCINTVENDTVRSGRAIISTIPPAGVAGDAAWITKLSNDFMVNAAVGSSGSGSERGLSSLLQFLSDNETNPSTTFFRPGSLRGIVFLSDEDDQSLVIPSSLPAGFSPDWGYMCDQATLLANNGASALVNGANGLCCNVPANNCRFGSLGTSCSSKTVDTYTYTLGVCVDQTKLIPVATVKQQLDTFFQTLDQSSTGSSSYFTAVITPTTGASVQAIQNSRVAIDNTVGTVKINEADRGDRYLQLGQLVGNGSLTLDIGVSDYSPVLDAIGLNIIQKISTFTLARTPTSTEEMIVTIIHQDGSTTVVPSSDFAISGNSLVITNQAFVLSLLSTDKVSINYQPTTGY